MTKPEDEMAAQAARIRATERALKHARLDALEAEAKHATYSELLTMHDACGTDHLDAADERILDINFLRGYVLSQLRGERLDIDSERREHIDSALAAVRGQLFANRQAGNDALPHRDPNEAAAYQAMLDRIAEKLK